MWRHYYKGTTKAAATAFWNLYPPAINPENVVNFPIAEKTPPAKADLQRSQRPVLFPLQLDVAQRR